MGEVRCLNCGEELNMISSMSCPKCGIGLSHMKIAFLTYVGPEDSLMGYQRSYKLVLLKSIFEEILEQGIACVRPVTMRFRDYYIKRKKNNLLVDRAVDGRIARIEESSLEQILEIIEINPYNAISKQGFIKRTGEGLDGVFVLAKPLEDISKKEIQNLLKLLGQKLINYYAKIGTKAILEVPEEDNEEEGKNDSNVLADIPIEELDLCARAYNALKRNGVHTAADLLQAAKENRITKFRYVGAGTLSDIGGVLEKLTSGERLERYQRKAVNEGSNDDADGDSGQVFGSFMSSIPIEKLGLGTRAHNALKSNKVFTAADLLKADRENRIMEFRGIGAGTLSELSDAVERLTSIDFCFADENFHSFRIYCKGKGISSLDQLDGIDFNALTTELGYGASFAEEIARRYENLIERGEKTKTANHLNVHANNQRLGVGILRTWGVMPSTIKALRENGYTTLKDIGSEKVTALIRVLGPQDFSELRKAEESFSQHPKVLAEKILENCAQKKEFDIYLHRAMGDSLQKIAEGYGVTRERIRQICSKFERRMLLPVIKVLADIEADKNGGTYFTEAQISELFDNDAYDKVVLFSLENAVEYTYLDFAGVFIKNDILPDAERRLCLLAEEIVGEGLNLQNETEKIEQELADAGFEFITKDSFINLLVKYNYKFYGNYVIRSRTSYGRLCAAVVADEFPDGIVFSDETVSKLRRLVNEKYGELYLPENDHALIARVCNFLVLRGRGGYIAPEHICIDKSVLQSIKDYIDGLPQQQVYYWEVFAEFEGILMMTSNIDNASFLHGVLAYYYPDEYSYTRDYICKASSEEKITIADRISVALKQAGRALSRKEIMNSIPGSSSTIIFNAVLSSKELFQWEANYYNCAENLSFSCDEVQKLEECLRGALNKYNGYCSEGLLYFEAQRFLYQAFERSKILNAQNLFYTAMYFLGEEFEFRCPHIMEKGKYHATRAKDLILEVMGKPLEISARKFLSFTEELHWSHITAGMALGEIEEEYARVSQDIYVRKKDCIISEQDARAIAESIAEEAEGKWYLPLQRFADSEETLPCGLPVNEFIAETLIKGYQTGWHVVEPLNRDRRYQRGILVRDDVAITQYDKLVAAALAEAGLRSVTEAQMLAFLQIHQLTYKVLPKELLMSDSFVVDGEYIRIKN